MLRNKIIYLCLLAYGAVFSVLYNDYVTLLLLLMLLCIPVFLLVILFFTAPFVSAEAVEQLSVVNRGESFQVSFLFRNRSIFPVVQAKVYLNYYNRFGAKKTREKITVFVDARSEQTVNCRLEAPYCGTIIVECEAIRIFDYFRLFSRKKKIKKQVAVPVYPDLEELAVELPPRIMTGELESDIFSKRKAGDDPSEVFDIRDYRDGDRLHRIHWKLSSKKSKYMVKEYSLPINCSAAVLLDFYYKGKEEKIYDFVDRALGKALSLSYTLLQYELMHYFAWYDKKQETVRRVRIEEEEDLYLLAEELFSADCYQEARRFPEAYAGMYKKEACPYLYYIGSAGKEGFESCGLSPRMVDIYEEQ